MTAWRYRRCPSCGRVYPGGELRPVHYGGQPWTGGWMQRRCPACGHVARSSAFKVVREAHARKLREEHP